MQEEHFFPELGPHREQIASHGFSVLRDALPPAEIEALATRIEDVLNVVPDESARLVSRGVTFAARNILQILPEAAECWRRPLLLSLLIEILGTKFGLVRALFFDKPPARTWSLGWHKDLTIAVRDNTLPSARFTNPTTKAGVPHVTAPVEVLEAMLTLRIHLDDVTDENGPLQMIPGSHRAGKAALENPPPPVTIYADRGDILAMRPLVSHASGNSLPGTDRHRRILHLEFASSSHLPNGYQWHTFLSSADCNSRVPQTKN